ncbi:hypothetical protein KKF55_01015 [Patescibacteria group bacterium]|nr:hypothetical protein [Patescibacteria group bacterium]
MLYSNSELEFVRGFDLLSDETLTSTWRIIDKVNLLLVSEREALRTATQQCEKQRAEEIEARIKRLDAHRKAISRDITVLMDEG